MRAHLEHNIKAASFFMLIIISGTAARSAAWQTNLDLTSVGVLRDEEVKA